MAVRRPRQCVRRAQAAGRLPAFGVRARLVRQLPSCRGARRRPVPGVRVRLAGYTGAALAASIPSDAQGTGQPLLFLSSMTFP